MARPTAEATTAELDALSATDIMAPIPPVVLAPVLSAPPFIPLASLINARDLGAVPGSAIRPGRIYRAGVLDGATKDPAALAWLTGQVTRVFDLRSAAERAASPEPAIPGVESVWYGTAPGVAYRESAVADFALDGGVPAWKEQLMRVMDAYKPTFREVLLHVRDRPTEPFLFHCTAGRDRTGVLAGMLHHLAGTPPEAALRDYMLSRIGVEPARERLLAHILFLMGIPDADAHVDVPGFVDMLSLRPAFWGAFLAGLQDEYGGWEGYITRELGFSEVDLTDMMRNLRL